jgi:hypothetical protein
MCLAAFSGRRKRSFAFVANVSSRMIYADDSKTDGILAAFSEVRHLAAQIINYAVDLLDHSLGEDFYFNSHLDRRDPAPSNGVAVLHSRLFAWEDLAERSISSPCAHSLQSVMHISNGYFLSDARNELRRTINRHQVFEQVYCDEISLRGCPVFVNSSLEEFSELVEESKMQFACSLRVGRACPPGDL